MKQMNIGRRQQTKQQTAAATNSNPPADSLVSTSSNSSSSSSSSISLPFSSPSFATRLLASYPPLESETSEEASYHPSLADLDPSGLSKEERKMIVSIVACCWRNVGEDGVEFDDQEQYQQSHIGEDSNSNSIADQIDAEERARIALGVVEESSANSSGSKPIFIPTTFCLRYLLQLLQYFQLDSSLLYTLQPLIGHNVDPSGFIHALTFAKNPPTSHDSSSSSSAAHPLTLSQKMRILLILLNVSIVALGGYDSRIRAMLRQMCSVGVFNISWPFFCRIENYYALLVARDLEMHMKKKSSAGAVAAKWLKVGLIGAAAGTALFFTAGLAAPAVGAGIAGLGIAGTATTVAFLASSAGAVVVASVFGGLGAGLMGYKGHRRFNGLSEFRFEKVSRALDSMCLTIVLNGWLTSQDDYYNLWKPLVANREIVPQLPDQTKHSADDDDKNNITQPTTTKDKSKEKNMNEKSLRARLTAMLSSSSNSSTPSSSSDHGLAEHSELYVLRWESSNLLRLGQALRVVTAQDVAVSGVKTGLKQTALYGLMVSLSGPATILDAGSLVVDHPWIVVLDKCDKAAVELANAIESRIAGKRPVSIIAYSMAARVVFLALEELLRRKEVRRKFREQQQFNNSAGKRQKDSAASASSSSKPNPQTNPSQSSASSAASTNNSSSMLTRMFSKKRVVSGSSSSTSASASTSSATAAKPSPSSTPTPTPTLTPLPNVSFDLDVEDADGVILDVILLGAPIPADYTRWLKVRSIVAGRLINLYSKQDWILRFIYPISNWSINVAGLQTIKPKQGKSKVGMSETADTPEVFIHNNHDNNKSAPSSFSASSSPSSSSHFHLSPEELKQAEQEMEDAMPILTHSDEHQHSTTTSSLSSSSSSSTHQSPHSHPTPSQLHAQLLSELPSPDIYAGIESWDVTRIVRGHRDYPNQIEL